MAPRLVANPNCRTCNGTGTEETVDWVDYGSTTVRMVQHFECDCVVEVDDEEDEEDEE